MTSPLIAVVGDAALDISLAIDSFDGIDEKAAANDSQRELGGTGANAAATIARLGGRPRLHAVVGDDPIGTFLVQEIRAVGIDATGVTRAHGQSTVAVILRSPERRLVVVDRGVADEVSTPHLAAIRAGADLVYVSAMPWVVVADVLAAARVPVIIGLEVRQAAEIASAGSPKATAKVLDQAQVVVTNRAGADVLAAIVDRLTVAALVVTDGASGASLIVPDSAPVGVVAPAVEVVDATGAGDCFAGALCHFLANRNPLESAVRLATIAASLSTRQRGAQGGLPTEAEVRARLEGE